MDTSKVRKPPPLGGVFFPMFLAVFWAEAAVGGGMLKLHHPEVVQFQDTPYYWLPLWLSRWLPALAFLLLAALWSWAYETRDGPR